MDKEREQPVIGIIASRFTRPNGSIISGIGEQYVRAVEMGGGIPLLVHLTGDKRAIEHHYRLCDGLLFAGGGDVDPLRYGMEHHPKLGEIEDLRDTVEIPLAQRAYADGKPMLGICRGQQLLNIALGGTLYQDIPAELPGTLDHRASAHREDREFMAHPVILAPDSWLAEQLGTAEIPTNTFHHQAIRDLAPGLRATGHAPDGVIEAVESTNGPFIIAVQSHPEELFERAEPRWQRLFAGFVAAVREQTLSVR